MRYTRLVPLIAASVLGVTALAYAVTGSTNVGCSASTAFASGYTGFPQSPYDRSKTRTYVFSNGVMLNWQDSGWAYSSTSAYTSGNMTLGGYGPYAIQGLTYSHWMDDSTLMSDYITSDANTYC